MTERPLKNSRKQIRTLQDQVEAFNQLLRDITEARADQEGSGVLDPKVSWGLPVQIIAQNLYNTSLFLVYRPARLFLLYEEIISFSPQQISRSTSALSNLGPMKLSVLPKWVRLGATPV